jgi:hypothetical protein
LLKQPDLLIVNRGLNALSSRNQQAIMGRITAATRAQATAERALALAQVAVGPTQSKRGKVKSSGTGRAQGRAVAGFIHLATTGGEIVEPAVATAILVNTVAACDADVTAGAVFWVLANPAIEQARTFDRVVVFEDGRLVEDSLVGALQPASRALKFLS